MVRWKGWVIRGIITLIVYMGSRLGLIRRMRSKSLERRIRANRQWIGECGVGSAAEDKVGEGADLECLRLKAQSSWFLKSSL
jgi:hypothetical protein